MAFTDIFTHVETGYIIRHLHSPQNNKSFGFIVGKPDEIGNLSDNTNHSVEAHALARLGVIHGFRDERAGEWIIRKIEPALYMVGKRIGDTNALTECSIFMTRTEAFGHAGGAPIAPERTTAPKSAHPANQKGYQSPGKRNGGK